MYIRTIMPRISSRIYPLPCGKTYSGDRRTVDNLVRVHSKVCNICKDGVFTKMGTIIEADTKDMSRAQRYKPQPMPNGAEMGPNIQCRSNFKLVDLTLEQSELCKKLGHEKLLEQL